MNVHHNKIYKTAMLLTAALLLTASAFAQTATQNYVRTRVPRTAVPTNARLDVLTGTRDSIMTTVQYIDGLGRPLQTVQQQASPTGKDIILASEYDAYGREVQRYLPYVNTSASYGTYRSDALTAGAGVRLFYNPAGGSTEGRQTNGIVLTPAPFAQTGLEVSPLGRMLEQGAPGLSWQIPGTPGTGNAGSSNHTMRRVMTLNDQSGFVTTNVTTNAGSRMVALYMAPINANGSRSLARTGSTATYPNSQLAVTIARDENWKPADGCFGTMEEYKDKGGHVVLKRTYNVKGATAEMLSTYYVYDDMGNLAFVLPPGASPDATAAISQANLDTRCYQYRYDARGRLFAKKVPGMGWEFMIYNKIDQVVATQDSVQRMKAAQEWTVSKYDAMGRPVITGTYQYGATAGVDNRAAVQSAADAATALWETPVATGTGYTANAWPTTWATTLSVSYFDVYTGIPNFPGQYDRHTAPAYTPQTTGLATATQTLVLNTTADYLWTVPYYDKEGKVIRTFTQHYLGGTSMLSVFNYDDVATGYNFARQLTYSARYHYTANAAKTAAVITLTSTDSYSYDHIGRKRYSNNQLQDGSLAAQAKITVSLSSYNEIGQLTKKSLHSLNSTTFLQNVDYRYNPREWVTNINNPLLNADGGLTNTDTNDQFGMELKYDNAAVPQYNGNIGNTTVKTAAVSGATFSALTYNYTYDKLNRLSNAVSTTAATNDNYYNENVVYDVMGNIQKLNRYDKPSATRIAIDSLTYTYVSGNKIDRVDDLGTTAGFNNTASQAGEYTYDGNGNQLTDLNKGLTQVYNMFNLPQTAVKGGTSVAYVYDAAGRKLRKLSTTGGIVSITEYIGGIQYEYTGSTPVLAFIQTEAGRARKSGTVYKYEYDLKDHLGNTRLTTTWDPADVNQLTPLNVQHTDYYAFGYTIQSLQGTIPSPSNHYLYNGKELQDETGLYDYGARQYDPVIARWTSVDPLAEIGRRWSPYNYALNNPVRYIDPDGMAAAGQSINSEDQDKKDEFGRDKYGANGMYIPPTDRGAKDFGYSGEKYRKEHEESKDENKESDPAGTAKPPLEGQGDNGGGDVRILLPTLPIEINLKKIGDAYYTNVTYEEVFYDLRNIYNLQTLHVEISSLNIMVSTKNILGKKISMAEAKIDLAAIFSFARRDVLDKWLDSEIRTVGQGRERLIDRVRSISSAWFRTAEVEERTPAAWAGAAKSNLIRMFP
jgi:RHS repeat-associated protein